MSNATMSSCSDQTCGCTGSLGGRGAGSCCKPNQPCMTDSDCCPMGASGAGLCGADFKCIAHAVSPLHDVPGIGLRRGRRLGYVAALRIQHLGTARIANG